MNIKVLIKKERGIKKQRKKTSGRHLPVWVMVLPIGQYVLLVSSFKIILPPKLLTS